MAKGNTPAAATRPTSAQPAAGTPEPKRYNNITLAVSKTRLPIKQALYALADKLKCRANDLVWSAIKGLIADPPDTAPEGSSARTTSAAGFWVTHTMGLKGLEKIGVVEVQRRDSVQGRTFYRYDRDDEKSRNRAMKQAQRAAQYDAGLVGLTVPQGGYPITKV